MKLNSRGERCRYLHAPGTQIDRSAFAALLKDCSLELPHSLSLEWTVAHGWVTPVLRVRLPESSLLSWRDYPQLSMNGVDAYPTTVTALPGMQRGGLAGPRSRIVFGDTGMRAGIRRFSGLHLVHRQQGEQPGNAGF